MLDNNSYIQATKDIVAYTVGGVSVIDLINKFITNDLNLTNSTTFVQFLILVVGFLFALQRLINYRIDSKTKSEILKLDKRIKYEEVVKAERDNFPNKWNDEFLKDNKL